MAEGSNAAPEASRRAALARAAKVAALLAGAGVLGGAASAASAQPESAWNARAFEAKTVAEAMRALGQAMPVESREVTIVAPEIAENGAAVPIAIGSSLAGVRRMLLLVEKNPAVLSAAFDVSDAVCARVRDPRQDEPVFRRLRGRAAERRPRLLRQEGRPRHARRLRRLKRLDPRAPS